MTNKHRGRRHRGRGRNKSVIGCLVRNHISILVQNANLAPRNALWCVIRQCINFIDVEPEARAELVALSFLAINRARDALVAEDDVAFAIDEATEIILILTRKFSYIWNLAFARSLTATVSGRQVVLSYCRQRVRLPRRQWTV